MKNRVMNKFGIALMVLLILLSTHGISFAVVYNLRADITTKTMPDGRNVTMWGFAGDSSFGAGDGVVTIPGPLLTVPPGEPLTINLDNNLSEPVSVVIPGQTATMTPQRNPDGRIRSFTHETFPGNTEAVSYTWTNLKPGTYLYHSGSHPQIQVQMGLYGPMKKDSAGGQAYPGKSYDKEIILLFSEIYTPLHYAVASNNFGAGKAVTSAIKHEPQYYLINGEPYTAGMMPLRDLDLGAVVSGDRVLVRLLNAGLKNHVPLFQGLYLSVIAEDGNLLPFPREQYSLTLSPQKTMDAMINPSGNAGLPAAGNYPVYDRRLFLTNAGKTPGGMLAYLNVGKPFLTAAPPVGDFGSVRAGLQSMPATFTLRNSGTTSATLETISIKGGDAAEFGIVLLADNCSGQTLGPLNTCSVQLIYSPVSTDSGLRKSTLFVPVFNEIPALKIPLEGCSAAFGDVPAGFWAETSIMNIYCAGITTGCTLNPLNYCPGNSVTRAQMAAFMIRSLVDAGYLDSDFSYNPAPYFSDVPSNYWAFKYIQKMKELGITTGCTPTTYCPENIITRGAMSAFLIRSKLGETFDYPAVAYFTDVPDTHFFFKYIQKLRESGITTGCTPTTYCPDNPVLRSQMAVFIGRTFLGLP